MEGHRLNGQSPSINHHRSITIPTSGSTSRGTPRPSVTEFVFLCPQILESEQAAPSASTEKQTMGAYVAEMEQRGPDMLLQWCAEWIDSLTWAPVATNGANLADLGDHRWQISDLTEVSPGLFVLVCDRVMVVVLGGGKLVGRHRHAEQLLCTATLTYAVRDTIGSQQRWTSLVARRVSIYAARQSFHSRPSSQRTDVQDFWWPN